MAAGNQAALDAATVAVLLVESPQFFSPRILLGRDKDCRRCLEAARKGRMTFCGYALSHSAYKETKNWRVSSRARPATRKPMSSFGRT